VFDGVWADHRGPVYGFLLGRTSDRDTARDLLQDTFLRVWRRLDDVTEMAAGERRAWIFAVARNLLTDHYRAQATRAGTLESLRQAQLARRDEAAPARPEPTRTGDPASAYELSDTVATVAAAVSALPDEQRQIVTMAAVGEMTSAQIGAALGQPAGTVRYKLSMARKALARDLDLGERSTT